MVCVLGFESLVQLSDFGPDWPQKARDGRNHHPAAQQDKSIDHAAERRERDLRFVRSIMLNYAQADADLVAFIMLHNQPRFSHKQKIRVSYAPWEKKKGFWWGMVMVAGVILLPGAEHIVSS